MTSTMASESYWGFDTLVVDYLEHYKLAPPAPLFGQQPPMQTPMAAFRADDPVTVTSRCDGLIHEYRQAA